MRTVEFEGKTYTLTQEAYVGTYATKYHAAAVDDEGNKYTITWETTEEWDNARKIDLSYCEDESDACDWDNPVNVELVELTEEVEERIIKKHAKTVSELYEIAVKETENLKENKRVKIDKRISGVFIRIETIDNDGTISHYGFGPGVNLDANKALDENKNILREYIASQMK